LGFLLSRPASRARIWMVKPVIALLCVAVIAVGTLGMAAAYRAIVGPDQVGGSDLADHPELLVLLAAISMVFFSVAATNARRKQPAGGRVQR
jgi:hypothetical protein